MKKSKAMALVKALISGRYKQGTGQLRNEGNLRCCLGVACSISKISNWADFTYLGENAGLPPKVQDFFGFHTSLGERRDNNWINFLQGQYPTLAAANDAGVSFKDIANYIRINYKDL